MANQEKSLAVLTIKDAARMRPETRECVARWLEEQAEYMRSTDPDEGPDNYSPRYRARLF